MFFRQYQLSCLSLFSYLIGDTSTGRAVVVDPQRDISGYLDDARAHGLRIERVIETHFHADFLSGHLELAAAAGAVVSYGTEAEAEFPTEPLAYEQRIELGEVVLEIRHTPGHTPESVSVVVWEHRDDPEPWGVLTGDTLFVGDVGRPDLMASVGFTPDALARRLYHSLHDQVLTLPDRTRVFPAHGPARLAGSRCRMPSRRRSASSGTRTMPCGPCRRMRSSRSSPRASRWHRPNSRTRPTPTAGTDLLDDHEQPARLDAAGLQRCLREDAVVLDGRSPETFASGHLRGSVNVSLDGRFAEYAGAVVRPGRPIVVVADEGREAEAKLRLARIGFDRVQGAVVDVERLLTERPDPAARGTRVAARDLASWRDDEPALQVVDVRNPSEQEAGVVPGAVSIPLARLLDRQGELDPTAPTVAYCAGGYRSSIAASLLRTAGFRLVADLQGGYDAWAHAGLPTASPQLG